MSVYQQNPDGTWTPAEPIGWQEEHGWFARLVLWLRRIEHCNDQEHARISRELREAARGLTGTPEWSEQEQEQR